MRPRSRQRMILDMSADHAPVDDPTSVLTRREREIVVAIGQGRSTADIGRQFEISVRTVESHLWHAYRKLGVRNRVDLLRWLIRNHLLDAESD